jgi:hypothetical protein
MRTFGEKQDATLGARAASRCREGCGARLHEGGMCRSAFAGANGQASISIVPPRANQ